MNRIGFLIFVSVAMLAAAGCGKGTCEMNNPIFDNPAMLTVVFHPRAEEAGIMEDGRFRNLAIPVEAGVVLGGRFYPAGTNRPTILFFHGNGEIVSDYSDLARAYTRIGINFMPVDYRGYGRSSGNPSITTMLKDAHQVFAVTRTWLKHHGYTGRYIVMGRSLGSASALELASVHTNEIDGLIIESGFADALALVQRLGWSPAAGQTVADTLFRHTEKIMLYKGPTLIIHGTRDSIIPIADAETLYKAAGSTGKKIVRIRDADHNNLLAVGFDEYFQAVSDVVGK